MPEHRDCAHQYTELAADFPAPTWQCRDCGAERPQPGYARGVRDYYLPGDPSWRRRAEVLKLDWARGKTEGLYQCQECLFLGTIDDFDVIGADTEHLFCGGCGMEVVPLDATHEFWPEPVSQATLF